MRRKLILGTGFFLLSFGLLVYLVLVAPRITQPVIEPLRSSLLQLITGRLSNSLHGAVEIGKLQGSLLSNPTLHNILLRDRDGSVIAEIDALRLVYNLKDLVHGHLQINAIELDSPQLSLAEAPDGQLNLTRALSSQRPDEPESPEKSEGLPLTISLERLEIQNGQIGLRLSSLQGVQTVEEIFLRLKGELTEQGLYIDLQRFTAQAKPADVTLESLQGALVMKAGEMQFDDLQLHTQGTKIALNGILPGKTSSANLLLRMEPLNIAEIGRLLNDRTLHGALQAELTVAGPPEALEVHGQFGAVRGGLDFEAAIDTVSEPIRYRALLDTAALDLAAFVQDPAVQSDLNFQVRLDGEGLSLPELKGELQVDIQTSHLGEIAIQPSQIHIEAEAKRFKVRHFNLSSSVTQMTLAGGLDLEGHSDLSYQLAAKLSGLRALLKSPNLGGTLQLQGLVSGAWPDLQVQGGLQGQELRYQDYLVETLKLNYAVKQLGARPQFEVHLLAHPQNLDKAAITSNALQAADTVAVQRQRTDLPRQQTPRYEMQAKGSVNVDDARQQLLIEVLKVRLYDRLWQAQSPLKLTRTAELLALEPFRLAHADEFIELSGALQGRQLKDLRLQLGRIDLDFLQRLLSLPEPVTGRGDLQMRLKGTLDKPHLAGKIDINTLPRKSYPVSRLQFTLNYAEQRLTSELHLFQQQRDVLAFSVHLPTDLALTAIPLEQRVLEAPLKVHLALNRPELSALHGENFPQFPELLGSLEGTLNLQGTYAKPALDVNLELQQLGVKDVVEQITAPVRLTADGVIAPSVEALRQALAQGNLTPSLRQLRLQVPTVKAVLPAQNNPLPVELNDLRVVANATLKPEGLQAQLHELRVQARAANFPVTDLIVAARLTPQLVKLDRLQIKTPRSEISARKGTLLAEQRLQLVLDITRLQLNEFYPSLPADVPATVVGGIELTGGLQAPQLAVDLRYAGAQIDADLGAQLQQQPPRYSAKVRLAALDVAKFSSEVQGQLRAMVQLEGVGFAEQERTARLSLNVDSEGFNLAPGLALRMRGDVTGSTLTLENFRVQSALAELTAQGVLSTTQPMALAYNMNIGDLTALQQHLGQTVHAKGALSGRISGTLGTLRTRHSLNLRELRYGELKCEELLSEFSAENMTAHAEAAINTRVIGLEAPSLPRSSLRLEGNYQAPRSEFSIAVIEGPYAQTQLMGSIAEQPAYQIVVQRMHLQSGDWIWQNPSPIDVVYDPQGAVQVNNFKLSNGDQQLNFQGSLSAQGNVSAEAHLHRVQIRPAVHAFDPSIEIPEGPLTLDLELNGSLKRPVLQGSLRLGPLLQQKHSLGEVDAQLSYAETILQTKLLWRDRQQELLRLQGTVATAKPGPLKLHVQSTGFDLARVRNLSKAIVNSAGRLDLDLRLGGTLEQPQVYGLVELQQGELRLAATGENYTAIHSTVRFVGNRVNFEKLQVGSRTGGATLAGWIELAGFALNRLDLSLKADNFTAMNTPAIRLRASSDLALRGSLQDMRASGKVNIPYARLRLDNLPAGEQQDVEPWQLTVAGVYGPGPKAVRLAEEKLPTPRPEVALPFLRADIAVTVPRNVWVQGKGTAVEMAGNLKIEKELRSDFTISGYVETLRGFASVLGKKFDIETGRVTFSGSQEIDPFLDITAQHRVSDYLVYVDVTGNSKKPELKFRSDPELEEADVVSLLVFGKTTDRLTSSEQSSLSNKASNLAGSMAAGVLERTLGKALGLDTIAIAPGESVGVGRYITQDLYLSYERIFRDPKKENRGGGDTIGLEYSINRRLKMKGTSSNIGETALDFNWVFDY